MRDKRRMPIGVALRFSGGAVLGIYGLGRMGDSVFPFHVAGFGLGVVLLALGALMLLGLMTARG